MSAKPETPGTVALMAEPLPTVDLDRDMPTEDFDGDIFELLAAFGVAEAQVHFESGEVTDIALLDGSDRLVARIVARLTINDKGHVVDPATGFSIWTTKPGEACVRYVFENLNHQRPGWDEGSGAFGEVEINVRGEDAWFVCRRRYLVDEGFYGE
jgi:hypothetical protein